eukprot:TRINITY_DN18937_c0_g2_i1.p2 TRINITY_DN18937_c0_g2~~TRINITY_DN18937_c0_g2_i1.p2  ORF type:complete len:136 (+),score=17.84 TRINITY_DN18937_c0_g2_i1:158-565(+)
MESPRAGACGCQYRRRLPVPVIWGSLHVDKQSDSAGLDDHGSAVSSLVKPRQHPVVSLSARDSPGEGLLAKLMVLKQRHGQLQEEIDTEMQRPLPDPMIAQRLKRIRLRIKDEIECIAGVLRTVGRPVPASLSAV